MTRELLEHHQSGLLSRALAISAVEAAQLEQLAHLPEATLSARLVDEDRGAMSLAMLVRLADHLGFDVQYRLIARNSAEPILCRTIGDPKRLASRSLRRKPTAGNYKAVEKEARALPESETDGLRMHPHTLTIGFGQKATRISARELLVLRELVKANKKSVLMEKLRTVGWRDASGTIASVRFVVHGLRKALASIDCPWSIVATSNGKYRLQRL